MFTDLNRPLRIGVSLYWALLPTGTMLSTYLPWVRSFNTPRKAEMGSWYHLPQVR